MPRFISNSLRTVVDLIVLSIAFWLAYLLRFEFQIPQVVLTEMSWAWPFAVLLQYAGLMAWGVPRMAWRYVSMFDMVRVGVAILSSTVVLI
jgi:FlaA1/EpsC-like NDP-sugar epimerase